MRHLLLAFTVLAIVLVQAPSALAQPADTTQAAPNGISAGSANQSPELPLVTEASTQADDCVAEQTPDGTKTDGAMVDTHESLSFPVTAFLGDRVNCGVGRSCPKDHRCCVVGITHWCCDKDESCDYDDYGCKD